IECRRTSHAMLPKPTEPGPGRRLDSWKAIATYMGRDLRTVQRWEKSEGLPIHRHLHAKLGSVYAFEEEIDAWWKSRRVRLHEPSAEPAPPPEPRSRSWTARTIAAGAVLLLAGSGLGLYLSRTAPPGTPRGHELGA